MNTRKLINFLTFDFLMTGLICLSLVAVTQAQGLGGPQEDDTIRPSEDRLPTRPFATPRDKTVNQGQSVMINPKYAGWQEAASGTGDNRVSDTIRGSWIMVDANGQFRGKVSPAEGADVAGMNVFLMNMGRLVKQTEVDSEGQFGFNNVRQGAYSLVGWGSKGFFAFGLNILAHNPDQAGSMPSSVSALAFQNATTINTDWIQHYSAQVSYRVFGGYEKGEGRDDPAALYGLKGLVLNAPSSIPATSISSHSVSKSSDGRLIGRVHQLNSINGRPVDVRTTKVLLLENDSVVASTTTDNFGVFEFVGVPDGSYGLLAAGVDGVGLIAINVGSANVGMMNDQGEFVNAAPGAIDFTMVSSETIGWLNHYASEVAYRRGLMVSRPQAPAPNLAGWNGGCSQCGGIAGGCNTCQGAYANSSCRSRGITFEQWQQQCYNGSCGTKFGSEYFGDGKFLSKVAEEVRRQSEKIDGAFDKAFYSNSGRSNYGGSPGYGAPGCQSCGSPTCQGCGY